MKFAHALVFVFAWQVSAAPLAHARTDTADTAAPDDARRSFHQGEVDYKLGRFDDALKSFDHAYELKPVPGLLFNIGQCHLNLKNYERAIFFYEGYLRDLPNAPNRTTAQVQLAFARREWAKQQRLATKKRDDAPTSAPVAEPPRQIVVAATLPAPAPVETEVVTPTPVYKKWWLWTIVGVVVVGGAAAATTAILLSQHAPAATPVIDWRTP